MAQRIAVFLAGALTLPVQAIDAQPGTITLTPQEIADCAEEGGCTIISNDRLQYLKRQDKRATRCWSNS